MGIDNYAELLGDLSAQYEQWVIENEELDVAFRAGRTMDFVRKHNPMGDGDGGDTDVEGETPENVVGTEDS